VGEDKGEGEGEDEGEGEVGATLESPPGARFLSVLFCSIIISLSIVFE